VRLLSQNAKVAALSRVPLLSGLSKRELSELARVAEDLEFPAGRVLAREGMRSSPGVELKVMRSLVEWIRTLVKDPTLLTG